MLRNAPPGLSAVTALIFTLFWLFDIEVGRPQRVKHGKLCFICPVIENLAERLIFIKRVFIGTILRDNVLPEAILRAPLENADVDAVNIEELVSLSRNAPRAFKPLAASRGTNAKLTLALFRHR